MTNSVQRSISVIFIVDDVAVAGQENATLTRLMSPIDITNKISSSWKENIGGLKTWNISCNGTYVKDTESFKKLERAFMNNQEITIKIMLDNHYYMGQALITNFPLSAVYNTQFKYTIALLGTGELKLIEDIEN